MSLKSTKKFIQPCLNQGKILAYIFLKRTNRLNARPPITRQPMNFIVKATNEFSKHIRRHHCLASRALLKVEVTLKSIPSSFLLFVDFDHLSQIFFFN